MNRKTLLLALALVILVLIPFAQVRNFDFVSFDDYEYVVDNPHIKGGLTRESVRWAFTAMYAGNWHPLTWLSHMLDYRLFGHDPGGHHVMNLALHVVNTVLLFLVLQAFLASPSTALRRRLREVPAPLSSPRGCGRKAVAPDPDPTHGQSPPPRVAGQLQEDDSQDSIPPLNTFPAFLVAAMFGIHPLHVESVAWISERKDLLSGLFMMLTLLAYGMYAKRFEVQGSRFGVKEESGEENPGIHHKEHKATTPGFVRKLRPGTQRAQEEEIPSSLHYATTPLLRCLPWYVLSLIFFALGLLSKPMLVTLPFVLLLLDYWPSGRVVLKRRELPANHAKETRIENAQHSIFFLVLEKIPFFALAIGSCLATYAAQSQGAVVYTAALPLGIRIVNAINAYSTYIYHTFWPFNLAVFYPYTADVAPSALQLALSVLVLGAVASAAILCWKRRPAISVGLFWFLGTLVPVIGLVQVGSQALADRYMYIPAIGLFIAVVFGWRSVQWSLVIGHSSSVAGTPPCRELCRKPCRTRLTMEESDKAHDKAFDKGRESAEDEHDLLYPLGYWIFPCVILIALLPPSYIQARTWQNTETLFAHAIRVTENNDTAFRALGQVYEKRGDTQRAKEFFTKTVQINHRFHEAWLSLGNIAVKEKDYVSAASCYIRAIRARPDYRDAFINLGNVFSEMGRLQDASTAYAKALKLKPDDPQVCHAAGVVMIRLGQRQKAAELFKKALELKPNFAEVWNSTGKVMADDGRMEDATGCYVQAIELKPGFAEAYFNLGNVLAAQGKTNQAMLVFETAVKHDPNYADALNNLGILKTRVGKPDEALECFRRAVKANPNHQQAKQNLAAATAGKDK